MAVATSANEPQDDADDESGGDSKTPALPYASKTRNSEAGFFTIYKRGQGKWTRLGTAFVALLLAVLTAGSLYQSILPYLPTTTDIQHDRSVRQMVLGLSVALFAIVGILVFWQINKPRNVDFLIATDSEMKKVNWTTRGELLGSTRVVVLFLFFIAIFLSVVDLAFYGLFHLIGVLQ